MKVVHKQPQDSLEICPRTDCCGSDACYVTELSPKIKNYFCFGCGFTTNDLMIHGEFDFSQYEETLPEITTGQLDSSAIFTVSSKLGLVFIPSLLISV